MLETEAVVSLWQQLSLRLGSGDVEAALAMEILLSEVEAQDIDLQVLACDSNRILSWISFSMTPEPKVF